MLIRYKNRETGEYRDVESDGPEPRELEKEVTKAGYPKWELQRTPDGPAPSREDATYAELLDAEVCGEEQSYRDLLQHEALVLDAQGVDPLDNPHIALSPGEVDMGLTPEDKLEQIRQQYAPDVPTREEILDEPGPVAEESPAQQRSGGAKVRARKRNDGEKSQAEAVVAAAASAGSGSEDD